MKNKLYKKATPIFLALSILLCMLAFACPLSSMAVSSDLVTFSSEDSWARLQYTGKSGTLSSGNYRFTVNMRIVSGTPTVRVGNDEYGERLPAQSDYEEYYDSQALTYTVTFKMTKNWTGNLGILIGNYGGAAQFCVANPALYKLDSKGNNTGSNLINIFCEQYYSSSRSAGKWCKKQTNGGLSFSEIPEGYFEPNSVLDPNAYGYGDYNMDGRVDLIDLVVYKMALSGLRRVDISLDLNYDGNSDANDLMNIIDILLGRREGTYLSNTYYKLMKEKALNIAYIGGSVTEGDASSDPTKYSYSALLTKWFKGKYPNAAISSSNLGVKGTGSYLGAARLEDDLLSLPFDLVFIEFSADDLLNGILAEQTMQNTEYMVRSLFGANPYADIVFVLVSEQSVFGSEYGNLSAVKAVAEYYNIPIVDTVAAMYERLNGTTDNWDSYYADSLNPLDKGHDVYYKEFRDCLAELILSGPNKEHSITAARLSGSTPERMEILTRQNFEPFKKGNLDSTAWGAGYWNEKLSYEIEGNPFSEPRTPFLEDTIDRYLYPKYSGALLEFTVSGTSIGIIGTIKENQSLIVSVDGEAKTVIGSTAPLAEYQLFTGLENTEHTVKIEAFGEGPYIAIGGIAVGS